MANASLYQQRLQYQQLQYHQGNVELVRTWQEANSACVPKSLTNTVMTGPSIQEIYPRQTIIFELPLHYIEFFTHLIEVQLTRQQP